MLAPTGKRRRTLAPSKPTISVSGSRQRNLQRSDESPSRQSVEVQRKRTLVSSRTVATETWADGARETPATISQLPELDEPIAVNADDESSSDEVEITAGPRRPALARRQRGSRHLNVVAAVLAGGNLVSTFLEHVSVGEPAAKNYKAHWDVLSSFVKPNGLAFTSDQDIDHGIVSFFKEHFFLGLPASNGEKTAAAVLFKMPQCGRAGGSRLRRTWRALKG